MPRQSRLQLPGVPLHVTQRGVNRFAIFADDQDRRHYLALLHRALTRHTVALHAYVLMGNHVHLLLTGQVAGSVSSAMRSIGQCYAQAFNSRHQRVGTLFQGRFKSCLIDSERYMLTVHRYIELNPVRAAMVERPDAYPWSSVQGNLGLRHDRLLTAHPSYIALGRNPQDRYQAYRQLLGGAMADSDLAAIRRHLGQERALGDSSFQETLQEALGRPVAWRRNGRPNRRPARA